MLGERLSCASNIMLDVASPSPNELRDAYQVERLTVVEVAERFGWGATKARNELLAAGVSLRRPGTEKRSSEAMLRERKGADREWLRARYLDDGWALRDLADELGRSKSHMRDLLARAGIEIRPHEREIDIDDLAVRYAAGASLRQLGHDLQISDAMIRRRLLAAGVTLRSPHRQREFPQLEDRHWVLQRYVERQLSAAAIGKEIGCGPETVRKALIRHGIPVRSLSEARAAHHRTRRR